MRRPGEVTVDKVWVAHDCGKALNRLTVEGQVQGSVWMGMGQAMSEEARYHDGLLVTANMLDYRVPTIQDSPPIAVGIVESNDPHGPFGAKEAGEGSLAAFLPALTNAIADATRRALQRSARYARSRVRGHRAPRQAGRARRQRQAPRRGRLMEALPAFALCTPATLADVLAARRPTPAPSFWAVAPISSSTSGAASSAPQCLDRPQWRGGVAQTEADANSLALGAAVTLQQIARHPGVRRALCRGGGSRRHRWPDQPSAIWAPLAATFASTRAASSTTKANGGARPTITVSRPRAKFATWRPRAAAFASPPSAGTWHPP